MEAAIQTVVKVFLKSAKGGDSMGGKDFDNLVKKQLGNVLTDTDSKDALKEMRKGLDENQDGKVSFGEYMTLIGYLANSMSDAKTKEKAEAPKSDTAAVANSAPAQENKPATLVVEPPKVEVKPPKVEVKPVEVALPEPSAVSAAVGVVVEEAEPKESADGALAVMTAPVCVAEGEVKVVRETS